MRGSLRTVLCAADSRQYHEPRGLSVPREQPWNVRCAAGRWKRRVLPRGHIRIVGSRLTARVSLRQHLKPTAMRDDDAAPVVRGGHRVRAGAWRRGAFAGPEPVKQGRSGPPAYL